MPNTNIPIRPLSIGMVRNLPSQNLPSGAMIETGNFDITTNGLKTRGGYAPLIPPPETISTLINDTYNYITGDVQNTFLFQENDGQTELLTVTNEALYKVDRDNKEVQRVSFKGSFDALSTTALTDTTVEITQELSDDYGLAYVDLGNSIYEELTLGDFVRYGDELGEITSLESDTVYRIGINVDNSTLWDTYVGELYGELNFRTGTRISTTEGSLANQYKVDHALVNGIDINKIVFTANRGLGLAQYDATGELSIVNIDSTSTVSTIYDMQLTDVKVARWYRNRLWIANTIEDGGVFRQRVRWSEATNYLDINTADRFKPENYVDLSDSMGEVLAIYPMGEILMVYCSDAVYYGRASNISGLPYNFVKINTPGIGLVGQSAITPWIDGHYFVGQDEIYFLDAASSINPIGTTILKLSLDTCYNKAGIDVRPDPANSRIVFLFPEDTGEDDLNNINASTKLYVFNYKTGGWSFMEASYVDSPTGNVYNYHYSSISSSMLYSGHSNWDDYIAIDPVGPNVDSTYQWEDWKTLFSNWDTLKDGQLTDHTFLYGLAFRDEDSSLVTTDFYVELFDLETDQLGYELIASPVKKSLISADYDFDIPDDNKQVNRFTLKLEDHVIENTLFDVYVSVDRGKNYKPVDQLMILSGEDEGKVNFRAKGSTFRFKVESSDLNNNTINEVVIRLSKRGKEQ